jgi:AraC-like DNA-binding protein
MDVLSHFLTALKIRSTSISKWSLHAPCGVMVKDFTPSYLLTLVSGEDLIISADKHTFALNVGDSILAPMGGECRIGSREASQYTPINNLRWEGLESEKFDINHHHSSAMKVQIGDAGPVSILLGIAFSLHDHNQFLVANNLPRFIYLSRDDNTLFNLLQPAVEFLSNDSQAGYFALATQLAESIIIGTLRAYILNTTHVHVGALKGLAHPQLSKALRGMHGSPQQQWTVESLARTAGMSRSSFAAKFAQEVGKSPIEYLKDLRINLAKDLLLSGKDSIVEVATRSGFQSDRVFRSLFQKATGRSPKAYRQANGH